MNTNTFSKLTLGALAVVALGLASPALAEVKSPRDAASGQATGKRQHQPVTCVEGEVCPDAEAASASEVNTAREAGSGMATGKRAHKPMVRSEAGAEAQDHNSSRSNKSSSISDGADDDNDGMDPQGMAINEKGMPGNTKAKAGKTGSAK